MPNVRSLTFACWSDTTYMYVCDLHLVYNLAKAVAACVNYGLEVVGLQGFAESATNMNIVCIDHRSKPASTATACTHAVQSG